MNPEDETGYFVTWEVEWRNLGYTTTCEFEDAGLAAAQDTVELIKDTRLALQAADPDGESVSIPKIENIKMVFRHTREIDGRIIKREDVEE